MDLFLSFLVPNDYVLNVLILVGIYLILAQSFNLTFGLGKLFNLSHVASYSIGAYVTALGTTEGLSALNPVLGESVIRSIESVLGVDGALPFLPCAILSVLLSAIFALLIGGISLRLESDYFAIGSLAFSAVISALLINWKSLTRGVLGIPGIPRPTVLGIELAENSSFLILVSVSVLLVFTVLWFVFNSAYGRTLRGLGEFEAGAVALGRNPERVRTVAFVISSGCAGLAGALFATYLNYIDPSSFSLSEMILVLTIVVVGKPGSFWGCCFATFLLMVLPEALRFVELPPGILGPMRQMLYALILFFVVWWNRRTLFPPERTI